VDDVAHQPEVDRLPVDDGVAPGGGEQPGVLAGEPDRVRAVGVEQADELTADLAHEHHPDDVHRLRGGHPQAAAELRPDAQAVQHHRDLRSAPVHDDHPDPAQPQEDDVLREGLLEVLVDHRVAAVLHHDGLAVELLDPRQCLGEDGSLVERSLPGAGRGRGVGPHEEYAEFSWT
jgi:hypothetical protein